MNGASVRSSVPETSATTVAAGFRDEFSRPLFSGGTTEMAIMAIAIALPLHYLIGARINGHQWLWPWQFLRYIGTIAGVTII